MSDPTSLEITAGSAQVVALTTANAASAAIGTANPGQPSYNTVVRLVSTADVWVTVGVTPVSVAATAPAWLLPAGVVEYVEVPLGHKVAGILASGTGSLSIAPATK